MLVISKPFDLICYTKIKWSIIRIVRNYVSFMQNGLNTFSHFLSNQRKMVMETELDRFVTWEFNILIPCLKLRYLWRWTVLKLNYFWHQTLITLKCNWSFVIGCLISLWVRKERVRRHLTSFRSTAQGDIQELPWASFRHDGLDRLKTPPWCRKTILRSIKKWMESVVKNVAVCNKAPKA